jgi:hypothetical protein
MSKRSVDLFVQAHPDPSQEVRAIKSANESLTDAYTQRFGVAAPSHYNGAAFTTAEWVSAANGFTSDLNNDRIPITKNGRQQDKQRFDRLVPNVLGAFQSTLDRVEGAAWDEMVRAGTASANAHLRNAAVAWQYQQDPPPPVGRRTSALLSDDNREVAGPGPLMAQFGHFSATALSFNSSAARNLRNSSHSLAIPAINVPMVIDLDEVGAVLTSDGPCLESSILNLLAALPANQLQIRVFDPDKGGNSAKFLYDLGDVAEKIIGERVKTSERDLSDLLQETEEHITLVTQRYLQGEHKSLTEYNKAAGEVAEPYRLLLLYDFPSGFSRAGHLDVDQVERIARIIRNGSRAGVFVFLVCTADLSNTLLGLNGTSPSNARESIRPVVNAVKDCLWLISSGSLPTNTLTRIQKSFNANQTLDCLSGVSRSAFGASISADVRVYWSFIPQSPLPRLIASSIIKQIQRNLHSADDVKVTPARVAQLASSAQASAAATLGLRAGTVAEPDDDATWWRATSEDRVSGHFGRIGARGVADLTVDSEDSFGALIGGRPGSGKSVLLHAVIMSIAIEYSPREVELFLIDFKEGVEFKQYATIGLPHARVIAIESERDFGLSVLRGANDEIVRRGALFRDVGDGANTKLGQYRRHSREPLPRLVLIIDEFQQLFFRDDAIASEAAEILEQLLRKGRAFGVHVILASQSLAGMASLGKHVLGFIPTRIAMQCSDADSRLILGEENAEAQTLIRSGEGILNLKGGLKDANQRFQATYWPPEERSEVLHHLTRKASHEGLPSMTTVFAGHEPVDVSALALGDLVPGLPAPAIGVPIGMPLALGGTLAFATLQREAGANILVVDEGLAAVAAMCISLATQLIEVEILDFAGGDDEWEGLSNWLQSMPKITVTRRRGLRDVLSRLRDKVDQRQNLSDFKAAPIVLVIVATNRGRDFDPNSYDDDSPSSTLAQILRDGSEVGVHVIASFDKAVGVTRRLEASAISDFGLRFVGQLSRDDSVQLLESEAAADLKPGQVVLEDLDRSTSIRLRKFTMPSVAWVTGSNVAGVGRG